MYIYIYIFKLGRSRGFHSQGGATYGWFIMGNPI